MPKVPQPIQRVTGPPEGTFARPLGSGRRGRHRIVGAALTIPSATESVMGSLPGGHTGVGAATNGTFLQVGGALAAAGCVIALIALPSRARNHQQGSQDRPGPGQD